jgi:hypothetical protein
VSSWTAGGIFRALQGERFAFRCPAVLSDGVNQLGQSRLAVPERFPDAVFHNPAFNRLPGRGGRLMPQTSVRTHRISFEAALRSFELKTIELDQAIGLYYIYFPEQKTGLRSYFTSGGYTKHERRRGHFRIPALRLNPVSYLAVKVMHHLQDEKVLVEPLILQEKTDKIVKQSITTEWGLS